MQCGVVALSLALNQLQLLLLGTV
ncbi:MAG: hypothetical protein FD169_2249, partial [Bacillota bacterium]